MWALFRLLPIAAQLLTVGLVVVSLATAYGVWHYHVWSNGYAKAIFDIATKDKKAIERGRAARTTFLNCVDGGGVWDQSSGKCNRR